MRTVRRLFYRDIVASVAFVTLAFMALYYFIDFVDDLDKVGRKGRAVWHVALAALLEMPGHFYELFPIAVLIGTIYSLARMAQASEFTILRTGGLGPGRALRLLATLGLVFGALNFAVGDHVAPFAERASLDLAARFDGPRALGGSGGGAWLKERHETADGEHSLSIHIGGIDAAGTLLNVRVFEFDRDGRLITRTSARSATVATDGSWRLLQADITRWPRARTDGAVVTLEQRAETSLTTTLEAGVVAAAVLPLTSMTTLELWRYGTHLDDQAQAAQQVQIRFWKKALYPLSCLVMVALALPFAYLRARGGGVSFKVFGGIMLGITFVLLNNLAGHVGMLRDWTPWVAASAPSGLFLLLSLAAFAWLVRYR